MRLFKPRFKLPPAVVALLIQLASLGLITLVLSLLWQVNEVKLTLPEGVLLHSFVTLAMTRWFNLAWWWSVIQPLFPLAVMSMLTLTLPPSLYLLIFSFFLVFYWSTFRTQVPYYPSTKKAWATVEKLMPAALLLDTKPISFVDIGSGLGGLILYLAKRYPTSHFLGVEIAPLPWLLSYLRAVGQHSSAKFKRSNYEHIDFSQFDVIFAYLSPAAMPELWIKAKKEMRPGSLLISAEFPIDGAEADLCICSGNNEKGGGVNVYLWRL